ncbi:MAG: hypothetical protein AAF676_04215 [Pseudomonadota bacterium]
MSKFSTGDMVVLISGSMRMAVESVEDESVNVVWCHEGKVGRDAFHEALLNKWEVRESHSGGDRGGWKSRDDRGGDRGGYKGRDDRGGDRGGYRGRDDRDDRGGHRGRDDREDRGGHRGRDDRKTGWDGRPRDKKHFRRDD